MVHFKNMVGYTRHDEKGNVYLKTDEGLKKIGTLKRSGKQYGYYVCDIEGVREHGPWIPDLIVETVEKFQKQYVEGKANETTNQVHKNH